MLVGIDYWLLGSRPKAKKSKRLGGQPSPGHPLKLHRRPLDVAVEVPCCSEFRLFLLCYVLGGTDVLFALSESRLSRVLHSPLAYHRWPSRKGYIPYSPVVQAMFLMRVKLPCSFEMSKVRCGDASSSRKTLRMWMRCGGAHPHCELMDIAMVSRYG